MQINGRSHAPMIEQAQKGQQRAEAQGDGSSDVAQNGDAGSAQGSTGAEKSEGRAKGGRPAWAGGPHGSEEGAYPPGIEKNMDKLPDSNPWKQKHLGEVAKKEAAEAEEAKKQEEADAAEAEALAEEEAAKKAEATAEADALMAAQDAETEWAKAQIGIAAPEVAPLEEKEEVADEILIDDVNEDGVVDELDTQIIDNGGVLLEPKEPQIIDEGGILLEPQIADNDGPFAEVALAA